jgi:hypothetical protein
MTMLDHTISIITKDASVRRLTNLLLTFGSISGLLVLAGTAAAEDKYDPKLTTCELTYNLKGWSFAYQTAKGEGRIKCDNGQLSEVTIESKGGGFTAGKSEIIGGKGTFTEVRDIKELFGGYARAEAHAGAGDSAKGAVVTKGEVSLALGGGGKGVDIGISFGNFVIKPKN